MSSAESHRQQPRGKETLAELTLIVRPHWTKVRTFTDDQRADAELYAAEVGGEVEQLL